MGKLNINIEADVSRHSTTYSGKLSGTLTDVCFFAGLLIGEMLRDAPPGAEKVVCELFAKGMASGKFGEAKYGTGMQAVHVRPETMEILKEISKEGENGNA